ncbi:MAG: hypothetical protein WBB02_06335 [Saprospiraceae bacterium]
MKFISLSIFGLLSISLFFNKDRIFNLFYTNEKIKGITLVAPPNPFPKNPIEPITNTGANWIALIPYAFSSFGKPAVHYEPNNWQWWGERPEGIRESIRLAKEKGIQVLLKPQVYIHKSWVGSMDFTTEADWQIWEKEYAAYLNQFIQIAIETQVEMVCIATEYNIAVIKREAFFRKLISDIRKIYKGKLCYSANWDHYLEVPFWDALDYIGISAYFPLTEEKTPEVNYLKLKWKNFIPDMEKHSNKLNKKIIFTEYGYLSVDGSAGKGWEIEKQIEQYAINQQTQANAYEAMYESLWNKKWWAGGFLWKWFPNGEGHEGYIEKDYTPQGKRAEQIIQKWYRK